MKVTYSGPQFVAERNIRRIEGDLFLFENTVEIYDSIVVPHVSGPTSILSHLIVESGGGTIEFGKHARPMINNAAIYLPRNSFVLLKTSKIKLRIVNYCSIDELGVTKDPLYFVAEDIQQFGGLREIQEFMSGVRGDVLDYKEISRVAQNLKTSIDANYLDDGPLSRFEDGDGLSQGTLTYHFKKDFQITPKEYLNRARVIASMYALIRGGAVADSGFSSGFADLSRYYKNFKKFSHVPPGKYRVKDGSFTD
jgi:AraC-like DNA-binding protein